MPEPETTRSDRRLLSAVVGVFTLGALMVAFGLWGQSFGPILGGGAFIVIALAELDHRLRHGRQKPGRHVKS